MKGSIGTILSQLKLYKTAAILTPVFTALVVVMDVFIPYITADLIDKGINASDMGNVWKYGGIMILMSCAGLLFGILSGFCRAYSSSGLATNLREAMYSNIQRFAYSDIDKYSTAGLVTRMTTDVSNIQNAFQMALRISVRDPLSMVFSLVMCIFINARLSIIFFIALAFLTVAVVLQKSTLFSGTILENLRWGREDASPEDCQEACRLACADEFIEEMPDKYETMIEEGGTGAGKTTITNLINRFYEIQHGTITYDGINVKDIRKASLRASLGMVLQETKLFSGTVLDNIRYGRLDATDEEYRAAAKLAHADSFIRHLPKGYDTNLKADGGNLSQGARQLLAIARAAVANPPVLVLDEATSSIDTRTEKQIQKGMDSLMKGRTTFVIAHRLSTVQNANYIIVLDHGSIIEAGRHDELLARKGKYYQLYTGNQITS
ncbi:MAG: ABC transporter ATP-binding protein/permease [Bacteroidales bacterium]|jgi:ABC-type multidrug transport system fused ATPase/permease subunit|nr:ABC transporter ATP-binding protein/permease [Bacteroidales bacterium]